MGSRLLGLGTYRPRRVVGNEELAAAVGHDDEWMRRRTGIVARRYADADETIAAMALRAAADALSAAGVQPGLVDTVLVASMSDLRQSPPVAPEIAYRAGAASAAALDIDAACAGFAYGVGLADALVRAGSARYVLVVGVDRMSDIVAASGSTAALFGDGAGAVVVGSGERGDIGPTVWGSDGSGRHLIGHNATWLEYRDRSGAPWPTMRMSGTEVFRWAIDLVPEIGRRAIEAAGLSPGDIDAFVPHQANLRITELAAARLDLKPSTAVAMDVVNAGNTSAASIPLALAELRERGQVPEGGRALLVGFGAGLAYAAQVVRIP